VSYTNDMPHIHVFNGVLSSDVFACSCTMSIHEANSILCTRPTPKNRERSCFR
jgi:hypothetical protein